MTAAPHSPLPEHVRAAPVPQRDAEPVAWRWKYNDKDDWRITDIKPFAKAGRVIEPLYAIPPALPAGEEVRRATIEECAIYLEKIGARYHYGKDLPAHLRALSPSSNGGEEDLVQRNASDASPPRSHPGNGE